MEKEDFSSFISQALENEDIPHIYFNGFTATISPNDMVLVLKKNNKAVAVLNTTHVMAKTMVELMGKLVAEFEDRTETVIMTNNQLQEKLDASKKDD